MLAVLLAAVVAALAVAAVVVLRATARVDTVGAVDLDRPMRLPALAPSTVDADGTRVFDLTMPCGRTDVTGLSETETGWTARTSLLTCGCNAGNGSGWTCRTTFPR